MLYKRYKCSRLDTKVFRYKKLNNGTQQFTHSDLATGRKR